MADTRKSTDGPSPFSAESWDPTTLPDFDNNFVSDEDIEAFAKALAAPETSPSEEDLTRPTRQSTEFITALNDWKPVHQKVKGRSKEKTRKRKRTSRRGKDETREGWTYTVFKWPLFLLVLCWILGLATAYLLTRVYISFYEQYITWRGKRQRIRDRLRTRTNYHDWVAAAKDLDSYLRSDKWKDEDEYAYYDSSTIRRVLERLQRRREKAMAEEDSGQKGVEGQRAVDELKGLVEACVKNNFAGSENPRLYSETYFGTKTLVQEYVDEVSASLRLLLDSRQLTLEDKRALSKHLATNFGRTALCLSGGATFAYYHFGIAKALLDANLLPSIITGTSGGALVAAMLSTRTDDELKQLLIPALAARITACQDPFWTWAWRWYKTGARFDSIDWARRCAWFCRGSLTFREAFERTGRILNVTCVPSDPHSPSILTNYLTSPDCVIWSAVLASAAVPGILNPVVLMRKTRDGTLEPYSFGHKWKDGSLRTDVPLKSLNLHFNVNFSIVSQVNPHISLFFFSSRGTVGRPVTHRRGRGWRGGFLGSAAEQYLKLDLTKWLKVLRHLELLPRPLGQDWSEVWLQRFSGTITIWPKSVLSDLYYILSDPTPERLARMIHSGQQAAFPKLNFISNRMKIEKVIDEARNRTRSLSFTNSALPTPSVEKSAELKGMFSEEDLRSLLRRAHDNGGQIAMPSRETDDHNGMEDDHEVLSSSAHSASSSPPHSPIPSSPESARNSNSDPSISNRLSGWLSFSPNAKSSSSNSPQHRRAATLPPAGPIHNRSSSLSNILPTFGQRSGSPYARSGPGRPRRTSVIGEIERQTRVFFDDDEDEDDDTGTENDDESAIEAEAPAEGDAIRRRNVRISDGKDEEGREIEGRRGTSIG